LGENLVDIWERITWVRIHLHFNASEGAVSIQSANHAFKKNVHVIRCLVSCGVWRLSFDQQKAMIKTKSILPRHP
jgi:hypothetical protein